MASEKVKQRYNKFLKFIYIAFGIYGFVAYFSYLVKQFIWNEGTLPMISAILGCLIAGVPVFFRRFFESKLPHKLFKFLENLFGWGMLTYFVTFMILVCYIFSAGALQASADELPDNTVFVVYGAGLRGEDPGSILKKRLDKTVEYMEELPDSVCIVTGGKGTNEVCTEASAMQRYLISKGIDPERILLEEKAHNTIQNIKYSTELMESEGYGDYRLVSVSNAFHIPRIELICARLGVDGDFVLAKDPNPYTMYPTLVREYMSYAKLFILGAE